MAMNLRIPEKLNEDLKVQADTEHTSVHALLLKAAEEYVARRNKRARILDAVDRIKVDYADALRRLGE